MKNTIIIIVLLILNIACKAQTRSTWSNSTEKGAKTTYNVQTKSGSISVIYQNVQDIDRYHDKVYDSNAIVHFDQPAPVEIVKSELSELINSNKWSSERLKLDVFISKNGHIGGIRFWLSKNLVNVIHLSDLERIETSIKEEVKPKVVQMRDNADYTALTFIVSLKKVKYE